jgi:RNA polymerase sigma factor for flagellar operon FliA
MKDSPPSEPLSPEKIFFANLDFIGRLAVAVARRSKAGPEEAKEFASELNLKLLQDDYAVLRKFEGTSTLKTYLTSVAANAFRDFCDKRWGKWRPSAEAIRLGPVALRLEELLDKEGWGFDQACEILRTNHRVEESRQELVEIWKRLPPKTPRRMEGEGNLEDMPAPPNRPEDNVLNSELRGIRKKVGIALKKVLNNLPAEDWLIVKMGILDGIKVVDIGRSLGLENKPLYRRLDKILARLRGDLAREEVRWEQVSDLLHRNDVGWGFSGRPPGKRPRTED